MHSVSPKRSLTILDVGHGNAAVLRDEGGVVVVDTGRRGTNLVRYLSANGITDIEALYLSHSDADHIGGAATLLAHATIRVQKVYLNADATQTSHTYRELA
jgi:beta-lactamase superfamily II metal-dependent hydrolase